MQSDAIERHEFAEDRIVALVSTIRLSSKAVKDHS